ncbi:hypothetical protein GCM10023149_22900 [Mucilaginibacter gynuensis]|uniref:Uncharacterized protein n=1 Tax=Mucilaginibacter gynuensis TaxID=1302236 RepID=A0ABP8GDW0_9SPHI
MLISILNKIKQKAVRVYIRYFYGLFSDPQNKQSSFAVIGELGHGRPYVKQYLGSQNFSLIRKYFSNSIATQKELLSNTGLVVVTEKMLLKVPVEDTLMVPDLVWLIIPLPATFDEYRNALPKSARSDLSRIKREGYTHALSTDINWVETFFHNYHLPAMQLRHDTGAYITQINALKDQLRQKGSEFINICHNDVCVASMLTLLNDGKYTLSQMGWLNGDSALVHSGAVAALYWQAIQRAYQLGCDQIILGGTPAHIDNGVLVFKAKWGARISKEKFHNINYLLINPDNATCYSFLTRVSLIVIGKDNKLILLTGKKPDELKVKDSILKDISFWYVLRDSKTAKPNHDDLPLSIKGWYDKVPVALATATVVNTLVIY